MPRLERLVEARAAGDYTGLVGLEQTLTFNISGHVLHSMFWKNLSPDGGDRPEGELAAAIDEHFGSLEAFRAQLSQAAVAVQGSGWAALAYEPLGARLIVEQIYHILGAVLPPSRLIAACRGEELAVGAVAQSEARGGATFDDPPVGEDDDLVEVLEPRQAVGGPQERPATAL